MKKTTIQAFVLAFFILVIGVILFSFTPTTKTETKVVTAKTTSQAAIYIQVYCNNGWTYINSVTQPIDLEIVPETTSEGRPFYPRTETNRSDIVLIFKR